MCPQDFWLLFPPRVPNISPPCARKAPHPHDWAKAADSPGRRAGAPGFLALMGPRTPLVVVLPRGARQGGGSRESRR